MKIETGIPLPQERVDWPFKSMKVNESVLIVDHYATARTVAQGTAKRYGWKFTSRLVEGGMRFWRVR